MGVEGGNAHMHYEPHVMQCTVCCHIDCQRDTPRERISGVEGLEGEVTERRRGAEQAPEQAYLHVASRGIPGVTLAWRTPIRLQLENREHGKRGEQRHGGQCPPDRLASCHSISFALQCMPQCGRDDAYLQHLLQQY